MIRGEAWAIAGVAAAVWVAFLLVFMALAVRSGFRKADRQGRLEDVRRRLRERRGGVAIFFVVWLLGNSIAVFVIALVIASLVLS